MTGCLLHRASQLTNLVEQDDNLLAGVDAAHKALHVQAAAPRGVASVEDLNDHVRGLHHLAKLLEEGAAGVVGKGDGRLRAVAGVAGGQLKRRALGRGRGAQRLHRRAAGLAGRGFHLCGGQQGRWR